MTKAGLRVQQRVKRYLENPVKNPLSVTALRGATSMAKSRRKAPTAKQLAARAAFAARYGGKKVRRGKKRRAASAAALTENRAQAKRRQEEEENMAALEENPRKGKKSKKKAKKSKAKRKAKASSRSRKAPKRKKASRKKAAAPRKASRKGKRRGKRRATVTQGGKVHVVRVPGAPVIRIEQTKKRRPKKKGGRGRSSRALALLENPAPMTVGGTGAYGELFNNPASLAEAYSMDNTKAFLLAAGGLALGLAFARGVDRWVATMKPAKSGNMDGNNPWYGRDAAFMQQRRPGALRLGVQVGGAVAGIGAAYLARNNRYLPWALGGIALGFGSNAILNVWEWFLAPRVFKIESPTEPTWKNRLYVVEQVETQDFVDGLVEKWDTIPSLSEGQQNPPVIQGVLQPGGQVYTLGAAVPNKLGGCGCGGGCGGCGNCNGGGGGGGGRRQLCSYVVQEGDNLAALLAAAGVGIDAVNALNNGNYWVPGNQVVLPYEMCMTLTSGGTPVPNQPNGGGGTIVFQPVGPGSAPVGTNREVFTDIPGGPPVLNPNTPIMTIKGTPEEAPKRYVPVDSAADAD